MSGTEYVGEDDVADVDQDAWPEGPLVPKASTAGADALLSRRRRIERYWELKRLREQLADFGFVDQALEPDI